MVQYNPLLGDKEVHTFIRSISSQLNVIVRVEFDYFEAAV